MSSIPEYLFHYTTVETLALILKNRTIRLNSLDKMDDLQEQATLDAKDVGKLVFVSSWTADATEIIPMWNMYASIDAGVRIRLRSNPFKLREFDLEAIRGVIPEGKLTVEGIPPPALIPLSEAFLKGFIAIPNDPTKILHEVEYSNEINKLIPTVVSRNNEGIAIDMSKMGKIKNTHWKFQKEWRYIVTFLKVNYHQGIDGMLANVSQTLPAIIAGQYQQPFAFYDMPIADEAYEAMSITISPRLSFGNRVIIESLLEKYNPKAEIKESALKGLI